MEMGEHETLASSNGIIHQLEFKSSASVHAVCTMPPQELQSTYDSPVLNAPPSTPSVSPQRTPSSSLHRAHAQPTWYSNSCELNQKHSIQLNAVNSAKCLNSAIINSNASASSTASLNNKKNLNGNETETNNTVKHQTVDTLSSIKTINNHSTDANSIVNDRSSQKLISKSKSPVRVGFYDIHQTIGKGNYAVVKLAKHRITKNEVNFLFLFNLLVM